MEIRQHILSYIVNPEDPSLADAHVVLTYGKMPILSQVSHQVRMDTLYLYLQWRRKHNLQDLLFPVWMKDDQEMFDELKEMIGYQLDTARTQAQTNVVGADQIWRLLQTLDNLWFQRAETRTLIDQLKRTIVMQRDVNQKLREENEKLVLALEMRNMELGGGQSITDA
jgi:hypothetical protein